ncbi:MAG: leucine-rich repeat domain-containing protein [Clostridia bacterium]|nr:leucine-rich repeat domain-containing protein [Clostridia bacterium]
MSYFCKGCGAQYSTEQTYCERCGEKVVAASSVTMLHADHTASPVQAAPQQASGGFGLTGAMMPEGFGLVGAFGFAKPSPLSFVYDTDLNGYEVSGCREGKTDVEIPEQHNGKPVVAIGRSALSKSGLISVTIPPSVLHIAESAFEGCSQLVEVNGGEMVRSIGARAFMGCIALKHCGFTGLASVDSTAFAGCYELGLAAEDNMKAGGNDAWL